MFNFHNETTFSLSKTVEKISAHAREEGWVKSYLNRRGWYTAELSSYHWRSDSNPRFHSNSESDAAAEATDYVRDIMMDAANFLLQEGKLTEAQRFALAVLKSDPISSDMAMEILRI